MSIRCCSQGPEGPENSNFKPTLYSQLASQPRTLETPGPSEPWSRQLGHLPKHRARALAGQQSWCSNIRNASTPGEKTIGKRGLGPVWNKRRRLNSSGQNKSSRNRHTFCFQTLPPKSLQIDQQASMNSGTAQGGSNRLAVPHRLGSLPGPPFPPASFSLHLLGATSTMTPPL